MSSISISLMVAACLAAGVLLGVGLQRILPRHHLSTESRDVVKLGMGLTASTSALVLALLVASAKSSYDTQKSELTDLSTKIILLDRILAQYGPETHEARDLLQHTVSDFFNRIWPKDGASAPQLDPAASGRELVYSRLQDLSPGNEAQRSLKAQALNLAFDLGKARWLLFEQRGSSVPTVFLVVFVFWLSVLFASFSLFAPTNITVLVTLFVCALSVANTIFLILELDRPFEGLIRISGEPLRLALAHLGQ